MYLEKRTNLLPGGNLADGERDAVTKRNVEEDFRRQSQSDG